MLDKDTISGIINKKKGYDVLNLGMSGNGPIRNLAVLREYGGTKKFKKILYFHYGGNDWEDLLIEKKNLILKRYVDDINFKQNLLSKTKILDEIKISLYNEKKKFFILENKKLNKSINKKKENTIIKILKLRKIRSLIKNTNYFNLSNFKKPDVKDKKLFVSILTEINKTAELMDSDLYFVYIPDRQKYFSFDYNHFERKNTLSIVDELNIKYIDLYAEKQKLNINVNEIISGHYNERGYNLITKIILDKINYLENN